MDSLKMIPYIALLLAITGVIIGASVITLSKFGDTSSVTKCINTTYQYNATEDKCSAYNSSHAELDSITAGYGANFTAEYYSVWAAQDSQATLSEQQPTVAIIAVMIIIISLIAGTFVYMKYLR